MIVKQYIKDFENHVFGMFVHFGIYSSLGKGEWAKKLLDIPDDKYAEAFNNFNPDPDWADKLAATAKAAGCKYITLTTRHHDGFSLFDTCGLNEYDAPHSPAGRDLVREFVDGCRAHGIVPFFYHTLLDWHEESYNTDFPRYLKYLRKSVEILCTAYGEIGGLWFDGWWDKPEENWEFDELYALIRRNQPNAMIINNTGLHLRGKVTHPEIDSVTFERGRPEPINTPDAEKYLASEMCQVFGDHWGYVKLDFNFKSLATIIEDLCTCKRYGSNFLLNIGPMGNGKLRALDTAMLTTLGEWINLHSEAIRGTRPSEYSVENKERDFILEGNGSYYLFCHNLRRSGSANVVLGGEETELVDRFTFDKKIKSVHWLESEEPLTYKQDDDKCEIYLSEQPYGQSVVVRIAKIVTE